MKHWGWLRPSPALLIACVALFVALGGTVLAAKKINGHTIRVKSLPGNRLAVGSVPLNRLHAGTISGSLLAPGSVTGAQIDAGSLGQVPNASHADSADTARHAQSATVAEHADDATTINGRAVGCREASREFAGACWDLRPSTDAVTAPEAAAACASAGGELPNGLVLLDFVAQPGIQPGLPAEWTSNMRVDSGGLYSVPALENGTTFRLLDPETLNHFRCITPLVS
jgi:hypothetical protein